MQISPFVLLCFNILTYFLFSGSVQIAKSADRSEGRSLHQRSALREQRPDDDPAGLRQTFLFGGFHR